MAFFNRNSSIHSEVALLISVFTAIILLFLDGYWQEYFSHPLLLWGGLCWLYVVILCSAFAVVRHADCLAVRLGEPYGTLMLTLSMISIEVMLIASMMLEGDRNPTLARDTMYSVVMIVLNGMVGLTLLLGGLRHNVQHYNLQGANAYLSVIIPLVMLGLILPDYTVSTPEPTLSPLQAGFLILMSVGLYAIFLGNQAKRHRSFFLDPESDDFSGEESAGKISVSGVIGSVPYHAFFLVAYLLPIVVLTEKLASPVEFGIRILGAPESLGGLLIAVLVVSPEALAAIHASLLNRLQRAINIVLGSVLATIGLTIPAVLGVGFLIGHSVVLGLDQVEQVMLLITLLVSVVTFTSGCTTILQGMVHLVLFFAYIMLLFDQ
jgi:Ca2+:H+ antiporter